MSYRIEQALSIATEVGHALDRAHRAGIVHRDLKPGNVFLVRGAPGGSVTAKLLDFGLAKAGATVAAGTSASMLTTTPPVTEQGAIVGTFQYMAPEQIEGLDADARTDIFAFGVVIYEMLTGRLAFAGKSPASVMGAILKEEPAPLSQIRPDVSPLVERVLGRCLAKDPDKRWQSVRDVVAELNWAGQPGAASATAVAASASRSRVYWLGAALGIAALAALAGAAMMRPTQSASPMPVIRFQVTTPLPTGATLRISPDGKSIAFMGLAAGGSTILFVRSLDSNSLREYEQVRQANQIAWSADGRAIVFARPDNILRTLDLTSGGVQTLFSLPGFTGGLAWGPSGDIVFGQVTPPAGLFRLEPGSTSPRQIASSADYSVVQPTFADDGQIVIYLERRGRESRVCSVELSGRPLGCTPLATTRIEYSGSGHLLFSQGPAVLARRFDARRVLLSGDPVSVAQDVASAAVAVTASGDVQVLTYFSGDVQPTSQFAWFDRHGARIADVGGAASYANFDLAADARYVVASRPGSGLWVVEVARGVATPSATSEESRPSGDVVWAPEGRRFAYVAPEIGEVIERAAFGGEPRTLVKRTGDRIIGLEDWSRDGRYLALLVVDGDGRRGEVQPIDGGKPMVVARTAALLDELHFSPAGRWMLYNSDESGRHEVYVTSIPPTGERWPVSTGGGVQGRWRADGRELYFLTLDDTLMAASFVSASLPEVGTPAPLFKTDVLPTYNLDHYAPAPDGQRFLLKVPTTTGGQSLLNVVVNWTAELPGR